MNLPTENSYERDQTMPNRFQNQLNQANQARLAPSASAPVLNLMAMNRGSTLRSNSKNSVPRRQMNYQTQYTN